MIGISRTVSLLSQVLQAASQISLNWLNQHSLLGYSKVLELLQIVNKTIHINSKNPKMQRNTFNYMHAGVGRLPLRIQVQCQSWY